MRLEEFLEMLNKSVITILATLTFMVCAALPSLAQTGELRGHVVIVQADGQTVPASEAAIDVYRTDIPGKYQTKANKKGQFVYAGLPYVGTYTVVASHPTAAFGWRSGVKVGRGDDYEIKLNPGDGKRPTLDELKALEKQGGGTPSASGSESSSDKAKREELVRKNAEIAEKNKKIEETNAIVARTFNTGNEALKAKNYDEAIRLYDEGIAADPDQPALLTQKAIALKARGVDRYNAAIQSKDDASKTGGFDSAKKDFAAAAEASKKSVDLIKAKPVPTDPQELASYQGNKQAALATRAETMRLFVTKVDQSQVDAGEAAYQEYIAIDSDPAKKAQAQRDLAQMLFDANSFDKALAEYKKLLEANPDDTDALVKSGMLLFNIGAMNNDKAKYQEAANYLQQFVDKAPDSDRFKADAKAILEELKNQQNVKAEKATTPSRPARRPRP
jgi:tetratricopeptide (TPR) repeat protein